jgi:hypothetical protein
MLVKNYFKIVHNQATDRYELYKFRAIRLPRALLFQVSIDEYICQSDSWSGMKESLRVHSKSLNRSVAYFYDENGKIIE